MKFTYSSGQRPLDGFTIKRGIGKGGFGEVYYALSDGGKEVALKLVRSNLEVELRGMSQCLNLKHANLVNLYDLRTDSGGNHWVVMEYVVGESLCSLLGRHPNGVGAELAREWFAGLAAAVGYLHDHGIVHRDLKPGNIFLEHGSVKVCDYGLCKVIGGSQHEPQTQSVGTVHYMAPEISTGNYNRQIDIYAAGIILYEMLTGRVPFEGESAAEILLMHLTPPPDLGQVPSLFVPVLDRALAKNPARRYQTMAEMAREVAATAAPVIQTLEIPVLVPAVSAPGSEAVPDRPSLTRRHQAAELCGSLVLAVLLAALLCLVWAATAQVLDFSFVEQYFFLTVACCWAVLIPAKFWTHAVEDSWARRVVLLGLGLVIGLEALWLEIHPLSPLGLPAVQAGGLENGPEPKRPAPHPWFDRLFPDNPSRSPAVAFLSYFGLTFLVMRWWKLVERTRPQRFRFGPVLLAAFWAYLFLFLLPGGREREAAFVALVTASAIVQFVSPWERPQPARSRRLRLRYA